MRRTTLALGSVLLLAAVGCGSDGEGVVDAGQGSDEAPADTRYRGSVAVLESPEHGPQMCLSMQESYPPQCDGPDVVGWDWDDAPGAESSGGTTWGSFEVTGTWDGERLTLTEPPGPARPDPVVEDVDFSPPCPEPPGGWAVVDPATTNEETQEAVVSAARGRDDFAGLWVDWPMDPAQGATDRPTNVILNVRVTGDIEAAERDLREVWGGALCVSQAERTLDELRSIQREIDDSGETVGSGIDESAGRVRAEVYVDGGLQAEYDERYGPGVVEVSAALEPVD